MLKFTRKLCLLVAGASLGWAWSTPASAESSLIDRADVVFANGNDDLSVQLVDYNSRMQRQHERECKQAQREQERMLREQERLAKKACKDRGATCRDRGCRDGVDWGGLWDNGCNWCSDSCGLFTDELGDPWTLDGEIADLLCQEENCVHVGGWASFGYTNKSDGVFNTRPGSVNLHQSWLYVERVADGSKGLDFGGRFDGLYGLDGENTQAYGNNPGRWDFQNGFDYGSYHWALPQLYGQVAYDKLSVKIGHFYTLQGYEVVAATGNFFYSHLLTFNFMEPFTHTGAVGTYTIDDDTEIYGGYVYGWDTGFDRFNGSSAFHGGFKFAPMENMSFIYIATAGRLGWIGDGYSQSIVLTTNLTDELTSVFGSDVVHGTNGVLGGTTFNGVSAYNYLLYTVSDRVGLGLRNEWSKFDGRSYQVITAGVNYKPLANVTIRPEYRYQWSPGGDNGGFNPLGIPVAQGIFGVDAVVTF